MTKTIEALNKYLRRNPLNHRIEPGTPTRHFPMAVVIPACGELHFLPATLESLAANPTALLHDAMVLVVINNHPDADPDRKENNQRLLTMFRERMLSTMEKINLHWIDAASPGHELQNGVGEARKTGMDAVLNSLDWQNDPLILCLDADTLVEPNYLAAAKNVLNAAPDAAGGVMRFVHQPGKDTDEEKAIRDYEIYMEHYVSMLSEAGSPYAYHAMGSAMICRAEAYLRAGGMKPRNAGEDFYFLQSLRKLGPVIPIDTSTVHPSARPSDRVPFGTGATVRKLTGGETQQLHHHEIFAILKTICNTVDSADVASLLNLWDIMEPRLPEAGKTFMAEAGFDSAWKKIAANTPKTEKHLRAAFHIWFDAFRTMKFVHFCENNYPDTFPRT